MYVAFMCITVDLAQNTDDTRWRGVYDRVVLASIDCAVGTHQVQVLAILLCSRSPALPLPCKATRCVLARQVGHHQPSTVPSCCTFLPVPGGAEMSKGHASRSCTIEKGS